VRLVLKFILLGLMLWAAPAIAGPAEDAEYDVLVAAAMRAPASVDYGRMRTLYAASKYYLGAEANPTRLLAEKKYNEPASQDLKDRMAAQLKADFALPLVHPTLMTIMGWSTTSPQAENSVAAYRGLIQAIIDTGDGESAATARVILHRNEGETVLENMKLLSNDWRRRDVEEGGRTFYVYNVENISWTSFWSGDRLEIWFDATAFQKK